MYQKEATVKSVIGLHARPASLVVKLAAKFKSKIIISYQDKQIDAKSMLILLAAGIKGGSTVSVKAEGEDEMDAVDAIVHLIETVED